MRNYPAGKFHNDAKQVRRKLLPRWPGSILFTHFYDYIVYQTSFITALNIKGEEQEYAPKEVINYLSSATLR